MAATFPGGIKFFTTKTNGVHTPDAAHINDLQNEVTAIETELLKTTGSIVDHGALAGLADNDHPQYLLATGKAADSDKLDGNDSTYFMPKSYKDGWIPVSDTWTYASATTITVPSGAASIYTVGMGIRLTANSVVKQAYIVKVEDTLLTVAGDALTNYTFSAISYAPNPQTAIGFPDYFNWTPTPTGWAATPVFVARFSMVGKTVEFMIATVSGTSNATNCQVTLPVVSKNLAEYYQDGLCGFAMDNGAVLNNPARWIIYPNSSNLLITKNIPGDVWINSGTKRFTANGKYEAA